MKLGHRHPDLAQEQEVATRQVRNRSETMAGACKRPSGVMTVLVWNHVGPLSQCHIAQASLPGVQLGAPLISVASACQEVENAWMMWLETVEHSFPADAAAQVEVTQMAT